MKKYKFLGVNTESGKCCVLSCAIPFDKLIPYELEASDFSHNSTNWCGRDDIERTLKLEELKLTGKNILLIEPLKFYGKDYDNGHTYPWEFSINKICETSDAPEKLPEGPHWYDIAVKENFAEPVRKLTPDGMYLYEDGRSCALKFKTLNDIQNFIMHMTTIEREFKNGYTIIFPNGQEYLDKYNEILEKEQ